MVGLVRNEIRSAEGAFASALARFEARSAMESDCPSSRCPYCGGIGLIPTLMLVGGRPEVRYGLRCPCTAEQAWRSGLRVVDPLGLPMRADWDACRDQPGSRCYAGFVEARARDVRRAWQACPETARA